MPSLRVSPTQDCLLQDNRPFFYLADTVWAAFANLSIPRWRQYLAYRKARKGKRGRPKVAETG